MPVRRKVKIQPRNCLRCERKFPSDGAHNRMCQACREHCQREPSPEEPREVVVGRGKAW